MGIISIEHSEHLFWLGRYTERAFTSLRVFFGYYDKMLDKEKYAYRDFLDKLEIEDTYGGYRAFKEGFIYGGRAAADADGTSIAAVFARAYDNALVTREIIGSESLAYMQMALDAFHASRKARNLRLVLMPVMDYLMAFWGSIDNRLGSGRRGTIIKCGKLIERLDLYFRFSYDYREIKREYDNLRHILSHIKIGSPYFCSAARLAALGDIVALQQDCAVRAEEAIALLERLFEG